MCENNDHLLAVAWWVIINSLDLFYLSIEPTSDCICVDSIASSDEYEENIETHHRKTTSASTSFNKPASESNHLDHVIRKRFSRLDEYLKQCENKLWDQRKISVNHELSEIQISNGNEDIERANDKFEKEDVILSLGQFSKPGKMDSVLSSFSDALVVLMSYFL